MEYPSFNKISEGPEDEGFFWTATAQPNWWRFGIRIGGDEILFGTVEVGEHEHGNVQNLRFNAATHERIVTTSDAPPTLVPDHIVIAS
jgi:hypothetical protein